MPSASDGPVVGVTAGSDLLSSLQQRLEARRPVLASGGVVSSRPAAGQAEQQQQQLSDGVESDEDLSDGLGQQRRLTAGHPVSDEQFLQQETAEQQRYDDQQNDQLLLVDLVSFDHCQELVQVPPALEQQVLMQFSVGAWSQPLPSQARQQADQLQRLPQESVGLWVPPHPRISSGSLYKLEQRLAKGRPLDVRRIVRALQEQFPDCQQPAGAAAGLGPGGLWLDESGLMLYEPSPTKPHKERPWRRYDQDAESTATRWVPASAAPLHLLSSSGASYRLDVELGRLEFEVHPYMALEQQLAAKLLCSFREYHRRASFGLSAYYGQKLAALEDALLNAREALFSAQQEPQESQQQLQEDQQLKLLVAVAEAEREVAEVRQLREEEDALLLAAVQAMAELWAQLQEVRRLQGGRHLTDVAFSVVQLPPSPGEEAPLQADGLTRQQLDIALLVAEAELIEGLPAYPAPFAVSQSDGELGPFKLRRVECTARSHAVARAEVLDRLQLLEGRVSADPDDPDIQELRAQLELLGSLPSRRSLSHQQEMELWNWAEQEVAAGRAGVYRPPRLQPCLTVLPAETRGLPGHSRSAALGSSSNGSSSTPGVQQQPLGAAGRSRLGQAAAAGSQQPQQMQDSQQVPGLQGGQHKQHLSAATRGQVLGLGSGQLLPVQQQGPKLPVKLSYYVRLLVNGRVVGTSEVLQLREDFTLNFRDVFSIRVLKWPDSVQMELWEKGTFLDTLVAEFFVAVPGLGGSPHVDPQAKPHSWTSPKPVPHNRLMQAVASLQPLGVLTAVQAVPGPGQPLASTAGSSRLGIGSPVRARAAAALDAGEASSPAEAAAATSSSSSSGHGAAQTSLISSTGPDSSSGGSDSTGFAAMYPSGRLFVRCGWVADAGIEPHFTPFQHTDGPFGLGQSKQTALQQSLRLADSSSFGDDGLVQVNITGRPGATAAGTVGSGIGRRLGSAPASPSKQQPGDYLGTAPFTNPLAFHGAGSAGAAAAGSGSSSSLGASQRKGSRFGGGAATEGMPLGADMMIRNPLAYLGEDVEVGQTLAPPLPSLKADRALQRVAQGVGHKASDASKWLSKHRIDPNDPRNALLLELLRAHEAAAHSGQAVGAAGVFRLDLPNGLSLGVDRIADRRVAFIKQRWTAGPYRSSSTTAAGHDSLHGGRQLRVTAPLSAKDTLDLQDAHREALALIEAASMGVGGFMGALSASALASTAAGGAGGAAAGQQRSSVAMAAASLVARQERALKWSQGVLARALETREATFRSFALRLRATASKLGAGRPGGRFKTDDVVKDTPLPEFKLDLSTLAAAFAPVRPLRPQRKAVKKVQASVPRETKLVITVQRASDLPRRLAAGGAGVRAVSPSRMTGDRFAPRRSTYGRTTGGTDSFNRGQFAAAGGRGFTQEAGSYRGDRSTFEEGDSEDPAVGGYSSRDAGSGSGSRGSCLSVFVEVHFRGRRQRTSAVDSNAPIWNEQVTFPVLGLDQEASPRGLRDSDSMITINVFDEVVTPTAAAKAMRAVARASNTGADALTEGGTLPERERRFLGCIRLSLAALYQAEVVDGTFKVDVPPVLFGYVSDSSRPPSLALYLTLKPRLAPPAAELLDDSFTPGEQGDVTRHARKWVAGISSLPGCKARLIKVLAVDPEGVALLLPRYLAPTVLPPALAAAAEQALRPNHDTNSDAAAAAAAPAPAAASGALNTLGRAASAARAGRGTTTTTTTTTTTSSSSSSSTAASLVVRDSAASALDQLMLAAARWVAHLPYARHSWLGKQQQSRPWAAHADVLGMAAGGQEEHAHLLAGYFMQLGQQALVVLGTSLSGAQAAFVLTTGQPLPSPAAAPSTAAGSSAEPAAAAEASTAAAAAATAATDGAAAAAGSSAEQDDAAAQHERLRQRLAAAAAAAQARQRVSASVAAAGNPALEAAAVAAAARGAGLMQPPNVAKLRLWNPMTGHVVPVRDPSCELREVGTAYSSDNVWANIQDSGHPWDISWHLGDASAWKPFFGPVLPWRELASIQSLPSYSDLEGRFYDELEASAEEAVRDALYEARSVVVTQPNNKLSRVLKSMLRELPAQMRAITAAGPASSMAMSDVVAAVAGPSAAEAAREQLQRRLQMVRTLQLSHNDRVSREMRGCLINGHILAVPFSDNYAEAVAQAVINSGVHRTVDPRVKFAMAAFVEQLGSAFVACIWVYVAAIRETS